MPDVRAWAGRPSAAMERDFERVLRAGIARDFPRARRRNGPLCAPRAVGRRRERRVRRGIPERLVGDREPPSFKIVTGVSTGALMAPFAFLGPQYDAALHEFYTTTSSRDIFAIGSILILARCCAAIRSPTPGRSPH